jgi:2-polyprenyl-3-methyl-5-hydroxy-6-metoxy-1,4-benzoquinol methylase
VTDELARLSRELESERKRHREQQVRLAVQISSATTRLTELQDAFARANESQRELVDRLQQLAATGATRDEAANLRTDLAATRDDVDRLRRELLAITTRLDLTSALGADINHLRFAADRRGRITDRNARRQYVQWLPAPEDAGTVIDLGCGRGEMLELLAINGFEAVGVDQDPLMIAHCRKAGYDVIEDHPVRFLEGLADNSITAIFCLQLVDRLLMPELEVLAELCQRKLVRGGVMIIESINPQSLHAYANQLLADATHVQAVHPDTLRFVCEQVGFEKVVVSDVARHPLADLSDEVPEGAARDAVSHLLSTVYGSTQYVLVATK